MVGEDALEVDDEASLLMAASTTSCSPPAAVPRGIGMGADVGGTIGAVAGESPPPLLLPAMTSAQEEVGRVPELSEGEATPPTGGPPPSLILSSWTFSRFRRARIIRVRQCACFTICATRSSRAYDDMPPVKGSFIFFCARNSLSLVERGGLGGGGLVCGGG
jgi:hypothetical protein